MSSLKAVLFDMDGVIVHSNPTHKEILVQFCAERGKQLTEKMLHDKVYGRTNRGWITNVFGPLPDETIEAYTWEKEHRFREEFEPVKHELPGLRSFLQKIGEAGLKKVVATSAPAENAEFILKELGMEQAFDAVLNATHIQNSKPDPEAYLKAAEAIAVEPESCVVIEDSLSGVTSGIRAGAKVIGVTTTHSREELGHCDLVINDFEGLEVSDLQKLMS